MARLAVIRQVGNHIAGLQPQFTGIINHLATLIGVHPPIANRKPLTSRRRIGFTHLHGAGGARLTHRDGAGSRHAGAVGGGGGDGGGANGLGRDFTVLVDGGHGGVAAGP